LLSFAHLLLHTTLPSTPIEGIPSRLTTRRGMLRSSLRVLPPHLPVLRTSLPRLRSSLSSSHCTPVKMRCTPLAAPLIPLITRRTASSTPEAIAPAKRAWRWTFYLVPVVATAMFIKTVVGDNIGNSSNNNEDKTTRFDTEKLYATKSTKDLALSWLILKLCSYDFVVEYGPRLLQWAEEYHIPPHFSSSIPHAPFLPHFFERYLSTISPYLLVG